ncbi:matrixin family metalloprotease [Streptomyces sp. NPDC006309]|uniref:matrixin family metalloprotease n=1 Tax=Streptomyces sp. NPDC006309 TaxID=3156749 RepID=UPI0033A8D65B
MTDIPVPGDYDGDGALDTAFWSPAEGNWFIQPGSGGQQRVIQFGREGDIPVPNDFDRDGKKDLGIWRPGDHTLRVRPSSGLPDWTLLIPQDDDRLSPADYPALTLFAYALFTLVPRLEDVDRPSEAYVAARESIRVFLRLAASPGDLVPPAYLARVVGLAEHLPASEAVTATEDVVAIQRRLVAADPANVDYQTALAYALFWLALRLEAVDRPDKAHVAARESVVAFLRLAASPGYLYAAAALSRVVQLAGLLPASEAVAPTREAVTMLRRLIDIDPADLDLQIQLASSLHSLTRVLQAAGRQSEAFTAASDAETADHRVASLRTVPSALERLGYGAPGGTSITDLLRQYGTVWNLALDGLPFHDQLATVAEHLKGRFCGVPDRLDGHGGLATRTAGPAGDAGHWQHGDLTWSSDSHGANLEETVVQSKFSDAFAEWGKALPTGFFSFRKVENGGDIRLHFGGEEACEYFTEASGAIGCGAPPPSGDVVFRSSKAWVQTDLFRTALHEIGHALGLEHSNNSRSVMYPSDAGQYVIDDESKRKLADLYQWTVQALTGGHTANRPSLAVTKNSYSDVGSFITAWRGSNEDSLWWSEFLGNRWAPQEHAPDFGSTHGPALTAFPYTDNFGGFYMAWKGGKNDTGIWYASKLPHDSEWGSQIRVPDVGTSCGPAIAWFNGRLHLAWKGRDEDKTIWHSSLGSRWEPQEIVSTATTPTLWTTHSPCLVVFDQRLYLFFRSAFNSNVGYSWLDSAPGSVWQDPRIVQYATFEDGTDGDVTRAWHAIGTSHGPAATVHGDLMVLAWKGVEGDSGLWFTNFDGNEFSGQVPITDRATAEGPAIASWAGRLYVTWKGGHETDLFYSTLF